MRKTRKEKKGSSFQVRLTDFQRSEVERRAGLSITSKAQIISWSLDLFFAMNIEEALAKIRKAAQLRQRDAKVFGYHQDDLPMVKSNHSAKE